MQTREKGKYMKQKVFLNIFLLSLAAIRCTNLSAYKEPSLQEKLTYYQNANTALRNFLNSVYRISIPNEANDRMSSQERKAFITAEYNKIKHFLPYKPEPEQEQKQAAARGPISQNEKNYLENVHDYFSSAQSAYAQYNNSHRVIQLQLAAQRYINAINTAKSFITGRENTSITALGELLTQLKNIKEQIPAFESDYINHRDVDLRDKDDFRTAQNKLDATISEIITTLKSAGVSTRKPEQYIELEGALRTAVSKAEKDIEQGDYKTADTILEDAYYDYLQKMLPFKEPYLSPEERKEIGHLMLTPLKKIKAELGSTSKAASGIIDLIEVSWK